MPAAAISRNVGAIPTADLDANTVDWSYFLRVDIDAPVGTVRYTDRLASFTGNIDGSSETWTAGKGLKVGKLDQGRQFVLTPSTFSVANLDYVWSNYANSPGIRDATVQIWAGWFSAAGVLTDKVKLYYGKIDNHRMGKRAEIALKPWRALWARRCVTPIPILSSLLPAALAPEDGTIIYWGDVVAR